MAGRLPFDPSKLLSAAASKGAPIVIGGGALVGCGAFASNSIYSVEAGHTAIKYNRFAGIGAATYKEGVHFLLPWFERPAIFDVRARPHTTTSLTGSKDLQMVNISLRCLARPDPNKLPEIYRQLGPDYDEKVLPSIVNEVLKSVVAQHNASQLIIQRELVSRMVRQRIVARASDFNILLDDVAITHLSFSPVYEQAVEQKQVAQQQAERARYLVLKATEEKKRTIIQAEGETSSAAMIGAAMKSNPGFIELRRISTAKEISSLLSKSSNRMVLNTDSLLLNLMVGEGSFYEPEGKTEPKGKVKPAVKKEPVVMKQSEDKAKPEVKKAPVVMKQSEDKAKPEVSEGRSGFLAWIPRWLW